MWQKNERNVLLWGRLFVGAPVRPNMLNVPKSASVCPSVRCQLHVICSRDAISLYFQMKLDTNIHHVSGHCWEGFQGRRSKVKVTRVQIWLL